MAVTVNMPKLGFDMAEGTLVEWLKKVGDNVAPDDVIATIETDKANVEVQSYHEGVMRALLVGEGSIVPVGSPIAVVGTADEEIDLAALGLEEVKAPPEAKEEAVERPVAPSPPPVEEPGERIRVSPLAGRIAQELGIDLRLVQGTGPQGRIIKRDIDAHLAKREEEPAPAPPPPMPTPSYEPTLEEYTTQPLSPIRAVIARRMVESKQQAAHFYVTIEVDMDAAMALRAELNDLLPSEERISVNDLVIKAAAIALTEFPALNASFGGDSLILHQQINIGIAVARETGLVTTVVRDCDKKSLAQIAREAREVVARARDGRMRAEDMTSATFTVSNLGMFGVEEFSAIINPPQAAILAVGAVRQVPVINADSQLGRGLRMKATISADHRVTDGAEAARFLQAFKATLEQPMRLVL